MIELGSDSNTAMIGNLIMQRDDGEPVPAFRVRARLAALGLGAAFLLFDMIEMRWIDDLPDDEKNEENFENGQ